MVTIAVFQKITEAYIAKGKLDSVGIESFLFDEQMVSINILYANAIGGIKLQVKECDAQKAKAILEEKPCAAGNDDEGAIPVCRAGRGLAIMEPLAFAWELVRKDLIFWAMIFFASAAAFSLPIILASACSENDQSPRILLAITSLVFLAVIGAGFTRLGLVVCDGGKPSFRLFFKDYSRWFQYLCGTIVYACIYNFGLALLVIPGIIWAVQLAFWGISFLDQDITPFEGLSMSSAVTRGHRFELTGFFAILLVLNLAAITLSFGLGLFITVPMSAIAMARIYRVLTAAEKGKNAD